MTLYIAALEQAFLFTPLVLAVYVSYKILKICDLTAEGSFVFGACLCAICLQAKLSIFAGVSLAICGGLLAGAITSCLQRALGFADLISGILAIFILQSLCLQSMGRPNISLYDKPTLISLTSTLCSCISEPYLRLIIAAVVGIALFCILAKTLTSRLGLILRAYGNNPKLLEIFGKNDKLYCMIGLMLSNSFSALGGAITAQFQGFADISMGTGTVLIALSSVIIGVRLSTFLFGRYSTHIVCQLLSCFLGVFVYFLTVHSLISFGVDPINLRMCTALICVAVLGINRKQLGKKLTTATLE